LTLIVWNDPARVERELRDRRLRCPHCDGELQPWGHARFRVLRSRAQSKELRPRRARCSVCAKTSVLLPDLWLVRRVDEAAVIGAALLQRAAGAGHRKIAVTLDRPPETVRGWLRRFSSKAGALLAHFRHWALALDGRLDEIGPQGSVVGDALEVIGLATRAATLALGSRPPWSWASAMTGGRLLSHTSSPFPVPR